MPRNKYTLTGTLKTPILYFCDGMTIYYGQKGLNWAKNGRKKIIYIIPYTSIIEQNAKVFSNIFGAEYDDTESEEENIKKLPL